MASHVIHAPNDAASRSAAALLNVLCFLDTAEIHKDLITSAGLESVEMAGFPNPGAEYDHALRILKTTGKVTSESNPKMCLRVSDATKTATMMALSSAQKLAAFNAAVQLITAAWPVLTTFNLTDVERLQTMKRYMPHVVALRDYCLGTVGAEPSAPDMAFCVLLHEQAWLETMLTTVEDMHLGCASLGLPLSRMILDHHKPAMTTGHPRIDEHTRLYMNQCRAEAVAATILGDVLTTMDRRNEWAAQLEKEIQKTDLIEDKRTKAQIEVLKGMAALQCDHVTALSGASSHFQRASQQFDALQEDGEKINWMSPRILLALAEIHSSLDKEWPSQVLLGLLNELGRPEDGVFENTTSTETGMVLYAIGSLMYFNNPEGDTDLLREGQAFLEKAVTVLEQTQGEEALWTLAATYRMAVCMFDLENYEEACVHLDTVNRAFAKYTREWHEERGADILLQKARAMWKLGVTLQAIGDDAAELEAISLVEDACKIYEDVCGTRRTPADTEDCHWDDRILPMYR